ncbi:MAG: plasmid stabilization protein [Mesorhizobium sp.]
MGDLLIRNIPEALKREIDRMAKRDGQSLSAKSIDLLRSSIEGRQEPDGRPFVSAWDVLRPILYADDDREADEFAKVMEEVEQARKRDFGRPMPDFE